MAIWMLCLAVSAVLLAGLGGLASRSGTFEMRLRYSLAEAVDVLVRSMAVFIAALVCLLGPLRWSSSHLGRWFRVLSAGVREAPSWPPVAAGAVACLAYLLMVGLKYGPRPTVLGLTLTFAFTTGASAVLAVVARISARITLERMGMGRRSSGIDR